MLFRSYFYSAILVLLLPLIWGIAGFILNIVREEKALRWRLNKHQLFHLKVLQNYLKEQLGLGSNAEELKKELLSHGWDAAVVETALEEPPKSPHQTK